MVMSVILPILVQNLKDYATTVSNLDTRLINVLHPGLLTPNNAILAVALVIFKLTALPSVLTVVVVVVVGAATIVVVLVIWLVNVEIVAMEVVAMEEEVEEVEEVVIDVVVMAIELFVSSVVVLITLLEIVKLLK